MALLAGKALRLPASRAELLAAHGPARQKRHVNGRPDCGVARPVELASGLRAAPLGTAWQQARGSVQVAASSFAASGDIGKDEAYKVRRIGWLSFWTQLALSTVSAIVLIFTSSQAAQAGFPPVFTLLNLSGVVTGFISTFLAYGRTRLARRVLLDGESADKSKAAAGVLASTRLNMIGLGATLVGLQSTVGGLFMKTLTSASSSPYNVRAAATSPAALDIFAVQASSNTLLLHFAGLLFANWTLRILQSQKAKGASPKAAT